MVMSELRLLSIAEGTVTTSRKAGGLAVPPIGSLPAGGDFSRRYAITLITPPLAVAVRILQINLGADDHDRRRLATHETGKVALAGSCLS